jgi:hypothetical protein
MQKQYSLEKNIENKTPLKSKNQNRSLHGINKLKLLCESAESLCDTGI